MAEKKLQKKQQQSKIVEGISRTVKRELQDLIDEFQSDIKRKNQYSKEEYKKLCEQIQQLGIITNDCYNTYIGDDNSLIINSRHPIILLNYSKILLTEITRLKKEKNLEKELKKKELQNLYPTYSQNNVYQLLAKNKIQFLQYENKVKELEQKLILSNHKAKIAQQMTQTTKKSLQNMLEVYRKNYNKIIDLLKLSQNKENQFIQNNILLKQQIETINVQYNTYKKNYRNKINKEEYEKLIKEKLEKQFQQKLVQTTKQLEKQYQLRYKIK